MIKLLSIRNFKCFERADVNLGSLTLLTGFNAAVKSTVLQSLLLLSQGLRSLLSKQHLPLNGALVRLGTAGDVIRRGSDGKLRFMLVVLMRTWSGASRMRIEIFWTTPFTGSA